MRCQRLDWPAHKLLCARYPKFLSTRVSKDHYLAIWFPRDTARPRLIWTPIYSSEPGFHYPYFDPYLGPNNGVLFTIPFDVNKRRGLGLSHWLTVWYRDYDTVTNKSVFTSVEACHGMTVPYNMVGDYVVTSGQRGAYTGSLNHDFVDMTLADFRHALDWFSTYFDTTIREIPSGGSLLAVRISSPREQTIYGRELFSSVAVDREFPSTSDISYITETLGFRIRVCGLNPGDFERTVQVDDEGKRWTNPYAQALMREIDLESDDWGKTPYMWDADNSILLLRENGEDMDLELAKAICGYCLEVLEPLFERALAREISRQDVLQEITPMKLRAWNPGHFSDKVATEPMPRRGYVVSLGSIC